MASWLDQLFPYVGNNVQVLECPSGFIERPGTWQMPSPYPPRKYTVGYVANAQVAEWTTGDGLLLSQVKNPYNKVWFADGSFGLCGQPQTYDTWSTGTTCYFENNASNVYPISKRHRTGSNLVFFDGHAAWMSYKEVMPFFNADPSYSKYWDPDEDGYTYTP